MSINHKILRTANAPQTSPDEIETSVAQALIDLENNVPELKTELRPLQISAAREVDVRGGKKAIVIFIPYTQLDAYRKNQNQQRCVHPDRLVCQIESGITGSLENWKRNSPTDMSFSSFSVGC